MIPEIIINKIYWYIWKHKQKGICLEYGNKIKYTSKFKYAIVFDGKSYNWRNLNISQFRVYNMKSQAVSNISKNY